MPRLAYGIVTVVFFHFSMLISVRARSALVFLFDLLAVALAWLGAFFLRFNFDWPHGMEAVLGYGLLGLLLLQAVIGRLFGLHRGMWTFASFPDLVRVLKVAGVSALMLFGATILLRDAASIPRSVVLLYPLLLLFIMGGARAVWRMWREYRVSRQGIASGCGKPVIIVGAGVAGNMLVRELRRSSQWRVVGLVDDAPRKQGLELSGCRVLGTSSQLPALLKKTGAKHVAVAIPSSQTNALRQITELIGDAGVTLLTVPGLGELMSGRVAINAMRPVNIEDLLGRESVSIDTDHVSAMIGGRTVLVTGAGGSIGSELCRQVARFAPRNIVLLDVSEFALYTIRQWFHDHKPDVSVIPLVGDVKDAGRMDQVFQQYRPELVLHAAAYKHVPLMEVDNAWQAVRNNVMGTLTLARCALRHRVGRFVLVSTDKAVNPTNVMGATKRMAEMLCESLGRQAQAGVTRFTIVRFGNVLGSTGSVIPRFKEQIAAGGPITVTHPEITRYFMLIPEAAQLVLQAASMGQGGEVFVLDMGEPVRIVDLARSMIRLAGLTEQQMRIEFTGLRPGEKLYEELLTDAEQTLPTPHDKLRMARPRPVDVALLGQVDEWLASQANVSDEQVRRVLKLWIPEYLPYVVQKEQVYKAG